MWKYFAVFPLLIALAAYVSIQDHIAAKQCENEAAAVSQGVVSPMKRAENAEECAKNAERNSPSWYGFFRWPNGTTVWAIILTLWAIIEQAAASRQSVDVATRTLVTSFRPKVVVRSIKLDPPSTVFYDRRKDGQWKVEVHLTNIGGTEAKVEECTIYFQMYSSEHGTPIETIGLDWTESLNHEFTLSPGARHTLTGIVSESGPFRNSLASIESSLERHKIQLRLPTCHGTVGYRDGNGFKRETGFMREWKVSIQRFTVVDDPEHEYQD